jgi:hypothetical protein
MTKVRLVNKQRVTVKEFSREDFNGEIDLVEVTDQFGNRVYYVFINITEDNVAVYREVNKAAKISLKG